MIVKRTCCLRVMQFLSRTMWKSADVTIMIVVIITTIKDLRRPKFFPAWGRAAVGEGETAVPCHHVPERRLLLLSSSRLWWWWLSMSLSSTVEIGTLSNPSPFRSRRHHHHHVPELGHHHCHYWPNSLQLDNQWFFCTHTFSILFDIDIAYWVRHFTFAPPQAFLTAKASSWETFKYVRYHKDRRLFITVRWSRNWSGLR